MFLVYIDESGKPNHVDSEDFTLAALIVNEHEWNGLDNEIKKIKMQYFPTFNDDDVELHAKELVPGQGIFASQSKEVRCQLFIDTMAILSSKDTTIVSSLIDKSKLTKKSFDIEYWGYQFLFERICFVLGKKNTEMQSKGFPSEYGLLMIDSVGSEYDKKTRSKLIGFMRHGTQYVKNKHLISDPVFVSSEYRNMSQLSDMIAWVIRRHFRGTNGWKDQLAHNLFPYIETRLDKNEKGSWDGVGIKIFPK